MKKMWEEHKTEVYKGAKGIKRIPEVVAHNFAKWAVSFETGELEEEQEGLQKDIYDLGSLVEEGGVEEVVGD